MDLEIINKLFLELSQVATAKTEKERVMENEIADLKEKLENLGPQVG